MNLKDFIIGQSVYVTNEPAKCFVIEEFDFIDPEQAYINGTWYLLDELSLVKDSDKPNWLKGINHVFGQYDLGYQKLAEERENSKTQIMKDWAENNDVEVLDIKIEPNDHISFFDESLPNNYHVTHIPYQAAMNDWEIEKSKLLQDSLDRSIIKLDVAKKRTTWGEVDFNDYIY